MKRLWITLAVLVVLLAGLGVLVLALLGRHLRGYAEFSSPAILEIDLEGEIVEKHSGDPFLAGIEGGSYQLFDLIRAIESAGGDDRIAGIYLRVGRPGYGWAKAEELRERLRRFRETGKFVYAYLTPTDELGYYVAVAADSVYLLPDAALELNGFRVETPYILELFEKLGVEPQVENVGAYKSAADILKREDMSDAEREVTAAILRERYARFVGAVAEARGVDRGAFAGGLDRGLYLAADVAELGLVDDELYEPEVRAIALRRALGGGAGASRPDSLDEDELLESDALDHVVGVEDYVAGLPPPSRAGERKIGLVYAVGAIAGGGDQVDPVFGRTLGAASLVEMLRDAAWDERVDAVVLRVDSPGGDAVASEEIWAQIEELRRIVPVVVSMSDVAGSGGYYIAAGADRIVAAPSTITGSIGVLGVVFNAAEAWDRLGVAWGSVRTNPAADFPTSTRPMTEEERATFRALIQDTYRSFVERVAEGRGRTVTQIDSVAQGRIWSGTQARERGLVDEIGGLDTAIRAAKELAEIDPGEPVGLVVYPKHRSLLERLRDLARDPAAAAARGTGAAAGREVGAWLRASPSVTAAREVAGLLTGAGTALRAGSGRPLAVMPFVPRIR